MTLNRKVFCILMLCMGAYSCYAGNSSVTGDSTKHPHLLLSLESGASIPGNNYSSSKYVIYHYVNAGFALPGVCINLSFEKREDNGWGFLFQTNYIHNSFNAAGVLTENQEGNFQSIYPPWFYKSSNVQATGTYSYNQFAFLIGASKTFYFNSTGSLSISFHAMLGVMIFTLPGINGTITESGLDPKTNQDTTATLNYNIEKKSYYTVLEDAGLHINYKITTRVYVYLGADLMQTHVTLTNAAYATDQHGNFLSEANLSNPTTAEFTNFYLGLQIAL